MRLFGGDLGAGFFRGVPPSVAVDPIALVIFGALGIVVAALGSAIPALEAARAAPAAALKAGDEQAAFLPLRRASHGVALLGGGVAVRTACRQWPTCRCSATWRSRCSSSARCC